MSNLAQYRRYWWRHRHLLAIYAVIALASTMAALAAGYIGMMTLAHLVRPG